MRDSREERTSEICTKSIGKLFKEGTVITTYRCQWHIIPDILKLPLDPKYAHCTLGKSMYLLLGEKDACLLNFKILCKLPSIGLRRQEASKVSNFRDPHRPLWLCLWLDLTHRIYLHDLADPSSIYYYLFSWIKGNTAVTPLPCCLVSKIDTSCHSPLLLGENVICPQPRHN